MSRAKSEVDSIAKFIIDSGRKEKYPQNTRWGHSSVGRAGRWNRPGRGSKLFHAALNQTMSYFVYILQSESNGKYYIGSTGSVEKRLAQHNAGYSKSTKAGVPWVLRRIEEFPTLVEARKRERQIKKMKSRKWIEQLLGE